MEHNGRSISAKNANLIMAAIAFIISALLIVATYDAATGHEEADAALYRIKNGGGGGCEVCL
jgi:hypothetical protein